MSSASTECPFCVIGAGGPDQDLVVFRTSSIFVIPTLRQRPANHGQVIVLPIDHVAALHQADPVLRTELFDVVTRITAAAPTAFDAAGSTVFQNNNAPDQSLPHLHVHVVPRFAGDSFAMPGLSTEPASRRLRADVARRLRQALDAHD
jgi:histidine triad (HIT) family protein